MSSSKVPGPGVGWKTEYEELVARASVAAVEKETGLETVVSSLNEPRKCSITCREHSVGRCGCGNQERFVAHECSDQLIAAQQQLDFA
jgi:hypothetical protein